jgi:single-strand DNA-binding protein
VSSQNTIHQCGNLVADPELRVTTQGRPVVNFRIGVNDRYQVNGEWKERSSFQTVVAWGGLAENIATSLRKGDRVMVSGRLDQRTFDAADGTRQYRVEITADEVGVALRWALIDGKVERVTGTPALVASNGEVIEPEPEF